MLLYSAVKIVVCKTNLHTTYFIKLYHVLSAMTIEIGMIFQTSFMLHSWQTKTWFSSVDRESWLKRL